MLIDNVIYFVSAVVYFLVFVLRGCLQGVALGERGGPPIQQLSLAFSTLLFMLYLEGGRVCTLDLTVAHWTPCGTC